MYRVSNEDGRIAGVRNFGRLALFFIPFALGIAASVWLGVWIQAHYFLIDRDQERRIGSYVGAPDPERKPYTVTVDRGMKTSIDNVNINGDQMTVLFHNFSSSEASGIQVHWQLVSPDGTKLSDHWDWVHAIGGPGELGPKEKGIVTEKNLSPDPRASGIEVWVTSN
jgi:hypothetical protein